eukprot:CAMPEP_0178420372 /NCGR_PEP_ID=MMETSP0689_2-20121128/26094_1 /TAXON_ID=160604 /ORGANISM="Amphidinium massartii, Strain CS-259" /LENGTH=251 /DNA_ID=CAMNT_0020041843 /DNA_START=3 /DNA_END=755 /DNA_ORIENTATION=-
MAEGCHLIPGTFGIFVQGLLFLCSVALLVFKKVQEGAGRAWWEFGLDSSKQIIGAGWIHVLNLACAEALEEIVEQGDACVWYWINIVMDTTLGVFVEYLYLRAVMAGLRMLLRDVEDYQTGVYIHASTGEFMQRRYIKQLLVWIFVVSAMKVSIVLLMFALSAPLEKIAEFILWPFEGKNSLKLLVVMIFTPVTMNSLQFWVVDNFIKRRTKPSEDSVSIKDAVDDSPAGPSKSGRGAVGFQTVLGIGEEY